MTDKNLRRAVVVSFLARISFCLETLGQDSSQRHPWTGAGSAAAGPSHRVRGGLLTYIRASARRNSSATVRASSGA